MKVIGKLIPATLVLFLLISSAGAQVYTEEVNVVEGLNGNVGIRLSPTTSSVRHVQIEGNTYVTGSIFTNAYPHSNNTTAFGIKGNGSGKVYFDSRSNDLARRLVQMVETSSGTYLRMFNNDQAENYFSTTGHSYFNANSTLRLGIGTSSPSERLDVVGNIKASGNLISSGDLLVGSSGNQLGRLSVASNTPLGFNDASNLQRAKFRVSGNNNNAKLHIDVLHADGSNWRENMLVLHGNGNVGIGTDSPQGKLQIGTGFVFGGTGDTHLNLPGDALSLLYGSGCGTSFVKTPGAGNYTITHEINSTGYHISQNASSRDIRVISYSNGVRLAPSATSWAAVSDIRLKENIEPVSSALSRIMDWRSITYTLKDDPSETATRRVGVVAQDIIKTRPEAVSQGDDGYYSVRYTELIPDLIAAVQELKSENDLLKRRITQLENNQPTQSTTRK